PATWHKNDGDAVAVGDILLTLETDKVSTELQAEKAGTLRLKVPAGSEVKIGEVVATIEEAAAAAPSAPAAEAPKSAKKEKNGKAASAPAPIEPAKPAPLHPEISPEPPRPAMPSFATALAAAGETPVEAPESAAPVTEGRTTRRKMSPLRRKIATQLVMAQQTAAILTTFNEADMSAVMKLRGEMQESFTKQHGIKL